MWPSVARGTGLVVALLLALLGTSQAQHKGDSYDKHKGKHADHYGHKESGYGYGHDKGYSNEPWRNGQLVLARDDIKLKVDACKVKYPGVPSNTDSIKDGMLTSTVVGWMEVSCKERPHLDHQNDDWGYDSNGKYKKHSNKDADTDGEEDADFKDSEDERHDGNGNQRASLKVGQCFFRGITDDGIEYAGDQNQKAPYPAFITFNCYLKKSVRRCHPDLQTLNDGKLIIGGQGRVSVTYVGSPPVPPGGFFDVKNSNTEEDLLATGYYNGQAQGNGISQPRNFLPLARYNVGTAVFDLQGCANGNPVGGNAATPLVPPPGARTQGGGTIEFDLTI